MPTLHTDPARVLIVDDTPDSVWFLAGALRDMSVIQVARDGAAALEMLTRPPLPDVILLDVQMPGLDGYEVCRRLKENPSTRDVPVIFVTSTSDAPNEAKGLQLGAMDYVHKPFSPDIVRSRVKNIVEIKRSRDMMRSIAYQKARDLRKAQQGTIVALADVAEWRDPTTGGHIRRTQAYVLCIARALAAHPRFVTQLPPQTLDLLYMCAPLHDIGKVSIPDAILLKPDKLTPEEFDVIRKHSEFGAQILKRALEYVGEAPFLELAYQVARWHHECWDGSGYPDGLKGEAIPLAARIMAVADVYDALISRRPYKDPFPHQEAVDAVAAGRGQRFDPDVVDAFLQSKDAILAIAREYWLEDAHAGLGGTPAPQVGQA